MQIAMKPSLFAFVLDRLGNEIVGGRYDETGRLPPEAALCAAMGASRTVVREVLRVLSQKGLIVSQQKIGVRTLPSSSWNLMDFDVLDWIWRSGRHERYVRDFLEFRLTLEPIAAHQAALRASTEQRRGILANYETLSVANDELKRGGSRNAAIEADIAFHKSIFSAAGNHFTRNMGVLLTHMLRRQVEETTAEPGEFERGLHLHLAVAQAIMDRQAEVAFNNSYQLVRMPYDFYMQRSFPAEQASFPVMHLSAGRDDPTNTTFQRTRNGRKSRP